ncbi:MAG: hypothetical protein NTW87_08470 [Planctomycetota bacterium]|nr:hypothetical protein [Planctomycetota bacterium]
MGATWRVLVAAALAWLAAQAACGCGEAEYEAGGPLAGLKLPFYPTQHGEPPGHPGCVPNPDKPGELLYSKDGQAPELQLYDGSVEHYRHYMFKYMPCRSLFDQQSLLRNWPAKDIAGVQAAQVESYAEPVFYVSRGGSGKDTGKRNKPLRVVRCKPGAPVLEVDLGELGPGLYAVRVIGAVEHEKIERHRRPLYLKATINDGAKGEESNYRLRLGYVEEFYSVCEVYFHAGETRRFKVRLQVDAGSAVDLLVHNIDLHDVLAGTVRRPIKQRMNLLTPEEFAQLRKSTQAAPKAEPPEARLARDELLWNAFPRTNAQPGSIFGMGGDDDKSNWPNFGAGGKAKDVIEAEHGKWAVAPVDNPKGILIENKKLEQLQPLATGSYTMSDLHAQRPLPDPYPYKDDGAGIYTAPEKPGQAAQNWHPVADAVRDRIRAYFGMIEAKTGSYVTTGNAADARDAAVMLCRAAYEFPAMDHANAMSSFIVQPGAYGRDLRCRQRETHHWPCDLETVVSYDRLFGFLQNNDDLAQSVGRFVAWVKAPQDVIQLLDVYLVQHMAKRYMRYHNYWGNEPAAVMKAAAVLGDQAVADPIMEWLFHRTWVYPQTPTGYPDFLVTSKDRSGVSYIGSYFYAMGAEVSAEGEMFEVYRRAGGNPKYDLSDRARFPKMGAALYWPSGARMAGLYFPRIGDVTGPDKGYGAWFDSHEPPVRRGWRWTHDPQFAFMLKHYYGRKTETEAQWKEIEEAAAKCPRAPWLENRSRFIANWFGALETGLEYDDFRFRRAAILRIGYGRGHSHADMLDLQVYAHGYPATIDGGQRDGYSQPGDGAEFVHNLVTVEDGVAGAGWLGVLSDMTGARYMRADRHAPEGKLYRRHVALVDVDEGQGAKPLTPAQLKPDFKLDLNAVTPNSYVFDVVRVAGGKTHTYCFHGTVDHEMKTNLPQTVAWEQMPEEDKKFLGEFRKTKRSFAGDAPDVLQADWVLLRVGTGSEQNIAASIYNPASPRKITRLHVFGQKGARVLSGWLDCYQWKYGFTNLYVQRRSFTEQESVFPAVIEPYVGEPFIVERRLLDVPGNEQDARRAVAVEIKTKNGHTDICFADGRPEKTRKAGPLEVAAEFAFYSVGAEGLRLASITGGTRLATPDVVLQPASVERTGKVVTADPNAKTIGLDSAWPTGLLAARTFEIGQPGHWTTYTISDVKTAQTGCSLIVEGGADYYRSRVVELDAASGTVQCAINLPGKGPGLDKGWVASNEGRTKFWRAEYLGGSRDDARYGFKLTGAAVSREDFGPDGALCLWEYGVGDTVRQSTYASLRRVESNVFQLEADVDVSVSLKAAAVEISTDRKAWSPLRAEKDGEWLAAKLRLAAGPVFLKVAKGK